MVKKSILAKVGDKINYKLIRDGYKTGKGNVVVTAEMDTKTTIVADVPSTAYASNLDYEVDISGENPPVINIKRDITCPDDTVISKGKYLFYDIGQEYVVEDKNKIIEPIKNYTKVGNVSVDSNGIASNFSASNYIKLNTYLPSTFDIIIKYKHNSVTDSQPGELIANPTTDNSLYIYYNGNPPKFGIGLYVEGVSPSFETNNHVQYETGSWYWIRLIYNGSEEKIYVIKDNNYTIKTLPQLSSWSHEQTKPVSNLWKDMYVTIGANIPYGKYNTGSIDLNNTYINEPGALNLSYLKGIKDFTLKDNGNELTTKLFDYHYNEPENKANLYINSEKDDDLYYEKDELQLNVSKVGSTVINENGIASNFANNSYVTFGKLNAGDNHWEMIFKVKYKEHYQFQRFCGPADDSKNMLITVSDNDKLSLYISTNGSEWNISRDDSKTTLVNGTTYYIKALFNGTNYILSLSTDGINYNEEINEASTTPMYNGVSTNFQIGCAFSDESKNNWQGTIDLKESYIKIGTNEKKYFAEKVTKRYDIPSSYSEFIDNITIPAHALYEYVNGEWKLSGTSPFITQDVTVNADNAEITMKEIEE